MHWLVMQTKKRRPSATIVGAGLAGLTVATTLASRNWKVRLLEKSRGVGGRMATRRIAGGRADHGAQYFTARSEAFSEKIREWQEAGLVRVWFEKLEGSEEAGHPRYIGVNGITDLPKALAQDLNLLKKTTVQGVERTDGCWRIRTDDGFIMEKGWLVLTAPVPQAIALLGEAPPWISHESWGQLGRIHYEPGLALMAVLKGESGIPHPGGRKLHDPDVFWIADNRLKGISPEKTILTLHSTPTFARRYWDAGDMEREGPFLEALHRNLPGPVEVEELRVHRWRYTFPCQTFPQHCLSVPSQRLAMAGDGFGGPQVEGAFLSGLAAAKAMMAG